MNFKEYYQIYLENNNDELYLKLARNPEDNKELLQKMVSKAAKEKNYTIKAWHGGNEQIKKFDPSKSGRSRLMNEHPRAIGFFSDNKKKAALYGNLYSVYLKFDNPYTIDGSKLVRGKIGVEPGIYLSDSKIDEILNDGYDGNIFYNAYDFNSGLHTEYVVFNANQIKLSDPVTYDDSGKVIPLSSRFDSSKDDIRY